MTEPDSLRVSGVPTGVRKGEPGGKTGPHTGAGRGGHGSQRKHTLGLMFSLGIVAHGNVCVGCRGVRDRHMQCRVSEVRRGGLLATSEAPLGCWTRPRYPTSSHPILIT